MKPQNELSPWQSWAGDVEQRLERQQEQIAGLERLVAQLGTQLQKLEARPSYNIESIQYHFDQLKVEKLEGTLNIGMTAPSGGEEPFGGAIEQLAVGGPGKFASAAPSIQPPGEVYTDIYRQINAFLDGEALQLLQRCETELSLPLDAQHRQTIIEDIRKQMPQRIRYYMERAATDGGEGSAAYPDLLNGSVTGKTKRDAASAIQAYMKQLKNETEEGTHSSC